VYCNGYAETVPAPHETLLSGIMPADVSTTWPNREWLSRELRIRIAIVADAEKLVQLINAAFVVERVAFDGDRVDLKNVRALMSKGKFLIADLSGLRELAGCVYVEAGSQRCYLGLLCVAPSLQGKGLARQLAEAAEEFARNVGCHAMDLRIISPRADSLLPVYKHLGYSENGTLPFPTEVTTKVPCHYVLMAKTLL
jgi:GNAT superfamily N-acetyltransferase